VAEVAYDAAILTNLPHEPLELHGTFEAYRAAKLSLFERLATHGPATTGGRPCCEASSPAAATAAENAISSRSAGAVP